MWSGESQRPGPRAASMMALHGTSWEALLNVFLTSEHSEFWPRAKESCRLGCAVFRDCIWFLVGAACPCKIAQTEQRRLLIPRTSKFLLWPTPKNWRMSTVSLKTENYRAPSLSPQLPWITHSPGHMFTGHQIPGPNFSTTGYWLLLLGALYFPGLSRVFDHGTGANVQGSWNRQWPWDLQISSVTTYPAEFMLAISLLKFIILCIYM